MKLYADLPARRSLQLTGDVVVTVRRLAALELAAVGLRPDSAGPWSTAEARSPD